MESLDKTMDLPINEEFPELDDPGCTFCNFRRYMLNSLIQKGYVFEDFTRKMREAREYVLEKENRYSKRFFSCLSI